MTLPLPDPRVDQQPWELERQGVQRNFEALAQKFPLHANDFAYEVLLLASTGTQRKVAFGRVNMFFNGSSLSNTTTVTHGLGTTPAAYVCMAEAPSHSITDAVVVNETGTASSTTFTVQGRTVSGAAVGPGTIGVIWIAIG